MTNPFDIYPPLTLEKYPFLKENRYFEYTINLTPTQIKNFEKNNIITLDYTTNKKPYKVFLTNSQIIKIEIAKKFNKKLDLKFSKIQFKKTLPFVTKLNRSKIKQQNKDRLDILKTKLKQQNKDRLNILKTKIKQQNKDRLDILKTKNAEKAKQLKKLKLQNQLETLKKENAKKAKQLNDLKLDSFIKNTQKKYKEPKPKKKSIWDVIERPKANLI